MIDAIIQSYADVFTWHSFNEAVFSEGSFAVIGTLIVLEGLLSADNAIVLAVMVKHLPMKQRRKALMYGLVGAYLFRFIAIGIGIILIKQWWIQVLGGGYLIYLAVSHFYKKSMSDDDKSDKPPMGFWKTVMALQLMDIAFSVDSIIAAFGVSNNMWILLIGGLIGILMMRGVAQIFLVVIEKIPELEAAAFILIFIIGVKMVGAAFGLHVPQLYFFSVLVLVFIVTFIVHFYRKRKNTKV